MVYRASTDEGLSRTSRSVPDGDPVRGFLVANLCLFFLRFISLSRSLFIFSRISFSQPFTFISGFTFVLPIKFFVKFFEIFRKFRKFWCENWLAGVVIRFLWRSKSWIKRPLCISHPSSTNFNPQARFWIGEIEWKRPLIGYRYLRFRFSPPTIQTCYFEWVKRRCEAERNDAHDSWVKNFFDAQKFHIYCHFKN